MLNLQHHERQQLLKTMQEWITVDLSQEHSTQLFGGMSGTTVMRITPQLRMAANGSQPPVHGEPDNYRLPAFGSAIVKYGKLVPLAHEYGVYHQLPAPQRHAFAQIITAPREVEARNGERYGYLLLEDLADHASLHERLLSSNAGLNGTQGKQLADFLQQLYQIPHQGEQPKNQIYKLYIAPMYHSLHRLKMYGDYLLNFAAEYEALSTQLAMLSAHSNRFGPVPTTVMHGDLNLNNVMIAAADRNVANRNATRFRLIDLEKFTWGGDMAYDIGELVVDLEYLWSTQQPTPAILDLAALLEQRFTAQAEARGDRTFAARFVLAKARSLLKLIELWVRHLVPQLQQGNAKNTASAQLRKEANGTSTKIQANLAAVIQLLRQLGRPPAKGYTLSHKAKQGLDRSRVTHCRVVACG